MIFLYKNNNFYIKIRLYLFTLRPLNKRYPSNFLPKNTYYFANIKIQQCRIDLSRINTAFQSLGEKKKQKYSLGRSRTSIPGFKVPYDNRYTTRDCCIVNKNAY